MYFLCLKNTSFRDLCTLKTPALNCLVFRFTKKNSSPNQSGPAIRQVADLLLLNNENQRLLRSYTTKEPSINDVSNWKGGGQSGRRIVLKVAFFSKCWCISHFLKQSNLIIFLSLNFEFVKFYRAQIMSNKSLKRL